ncbi:MAG: hypothetical protein MZW92_79085 [Comamonadaceae bacterium]|nr:hypothetical protein [Comamonadaceae bacterium]
MLPRRAGRQHASTAPSTPGLAVGDLKLEVGFLIDRADRDDDGGGHLRLADGAHLHHRLHGGRPGLPALLHATSRCSPSRMLMLVMSNNFLQLFFGWEAVGLVSYLLIGFWYKRPTAIYANLKAFLVNRVGDFGFMLGIGLVLAYVGTLDYADGVRQGAPELAATASTLSRAPTGSLITVDLHLPVHRRDGQDARSSRCTSGCPTRWKARRRSRR